MNTPKTEMRLDTRGYDQYNAYFDICREVISERIATIVKGKDFNSAECLSICFNATEQFH